MAEASPTGSASSNRSVMIVLSYLWILALVPLLVEKEDSEVQWHAKHGIVLMVAEIAFWIAYTIIVNVIVAATFGLGCVVGLVSPLIALAFLVIHVMAIVKGLNGQRFTLPYVSEFANKF
ncbi:MAG: DUF4870 domain-containing protein [Acidobacteriota bacterium]